MERDASYDDKLQELERSLRDNVLCRLPGDADRLEECAKALDGILGEIMVLDKERVEGTPGVHPSSLGGCKRLSYYALKGTDRHANPSADPNLKLKMLVSSALHDVFEERMSKLPQKLLKIVSEEWIPDGSDAATLYNMRGKADEVIYQLSSGGALRPFMVWDYKFVSGPQFSRIRAPEHKHLCQLTAYMFGFSAPTGALIYVNKEDIVQRTVFCVSFDTKLWLEVSNEIRVIQEAVNKDVPPPREVDYFVCRNICKYGWTCKPPYRSRLV